MQFRRPSDRRPFAHDFHYYSPSVLILSLTVSLALQHLEQLLDALVPRLQGLFLRLYPRLELLKWEGD